MAVLWVMLHAQISLAIVVLLLLQKADSMPEGTGTQQIPISNPITGRPQGFKQRNVVFILTDDQDMQLESVDYMPLLQKHMKSQGTFFSNHFTSTAICCPSRVALWTGKQPHNTNVTDVDPPHGGFPKFIRQGLNENYLPVWMQNAGYNTYYTGKMFNSHTIENYNAPYLAGFTGSDFLLDPYTYSYLNSTYQRNHEPPVSYEGRHTADVIADKVYGFLDEAIASDQPFFLVAAPISPHSNIDTNTNGVPMMTAPIPAERHRHLFKDAFIPRTANFNPENPSGVSWLADLPFRNESTIDYFDEFYRARLQALQTVDELVDGVVSRLTRAGLIDDTYIIFSSDNGFHIGQHRLPPGKECAFEEDIRIPLYIRGPGILANYRETAVTTHIDLAPTIFQMAGIPLRADFDGTPLPLNLPTIGAGSEKHEHVTVEFWGIAIAEGQSGGFNDKLGYIARNNTYKAVRLLGTGYNLFYSIWCNNEHELYDLTTDPFQISNLYPGEASTPKDGNGTIMGVQLPKLIDRLNALLMVLKSCKGDVCVRPWQTLHPQGDINSLQDALDPYFDHFYKSQPQVEYSRCEDGYIIDAEGPQVAKSFRGELDWHHWT